MPRFPNDHINTVQRLSHTKKLGAIAVLKQEVAGNALQAVKTNVTTTATQIIMPDTKTDYIIRHVTDATVWIGDNSKITAAGSDVFPLLEGDILSVSMQAGGDNELYAIVASGSVDIYAAGVVKS